MESAAEAHLRNTVPLLLNDGTKTAEFRNTMAPLLVTGTDTIDFRNKVVVVTVGPRKYLKAEYRMQNPPNKQHTSV